MTSDEGDPEDAPTEAPPHEPARPALRIVRGDPTAEDLAVIAALLVAGGDDAEDAPRERRGTWSDPARGFRATPLAGPNGWRASYAPR